MINDKKVLYSGMQATGNLTLGNYLGALKNWVSLNEEYECFFGVMDLHSLTVRQEPADFRKKARNLLILYIAAGLSPEKNCIYFQSHVPAHAELSWLLNCFTYMGELSRMTQFKDKAAKHADNINAGLFTYPVLMAADILLYQADYVPIGRTSSSIWRLQGILRSVLMAYMGMSLPYRRHITARRGRRSGACRIRLRKCQNQTKMLMGASI